MSEMRATPAPREAVSGSGQFRVSGSSHARSDDSTWSGAGLRRAKRADSDIRYENPGEVVDLLNIVKEINPSLLEGSEVTRVERYLQNACATPAAMLLGQVGAVLRTDMSNAPASGFGNAPGWSGSTARRFQT
jgi:hypothetical protein